VLSSATLPTFPTAATAATLLPLLRAPLVLLQGPRHFSSFHHLHYHQDLSRCQPAPSFSPNFKTASSTHASSNISHPIRYSKHTSTPLIALIFPQSSSTPPSRHHCYQSTRTFQLQPPSAGSAQTAAQKTIPTTVPFHNRKNISFEERASLQFPTSNSSNLCLSLSLIHSLHPRQTTSKPSKDLVRNPRPTIRENTPKTIIHLDDPYTSSSRIIERKGARSRVTSRQIWQFDCETCEAPRPLGTSLFDCRAHTLPSQCRRNTVNSMISVEIRAI
jgi:hypothetical protein